MRSEIAWVLFSEKLSKWNGAAEGAKKAVEAINKFFDDLKSKLENIRPTLESFGTTIRISSRSRSSSGEGGLLDLQIC